MTTFHNVRLPEDVEQGAQGGPLFKTEVLPLGSGFEQRNISWSRTRGEWDISYGIQGKTGLDAVKNFFYARRGRAFGFRFKDFSDFEVVGPQTIGTGDGATAAYQAFKLYEDAGGSYERKLTRLVQGTLKVYIDDVLQTETTDYTVDYDTGIITLTSFLDSLAVLAIEVEFDVPVRFDSDKLNIRMQWEEAMEIPQLMLVEIKE